MAALAALVLAGGAYLARPSLEPEPVTIANPCRPRDLPSTGGIDGAIQDVALAALDRAACHNGSSREELALALVDESARRRTSATTASTRATCSASSAPRSGFDVLPSTSMSRTQRLTFLGIAAVIAVVAVVVILTAGGDDEDTGTPSSATQTATPTPTQDEASPQETETPTPTPTAEPVPLLKAGKVTRLEFKEGDTVKFRVVSDVDEEVHIHGYDIAKDIGAGETITISFPATIEGIFEIEFEDAKEQIGELRVEPN